mgnify:CR=1 FL=1|jgi:hypothetical protein
MKTKSFLFALITGIIFNTYAFAGAAENIVTPKATTDTNLMESQTLDVVAEDTLRSVEQQSKNAEKEEQSDQFDNSEKFAVTVVVFIAGTVGTVAVVVYCSVRSAFRRLNNLKYDRTNGWH